MAAPEELLPPSVRINKSNSELMEDLIFEILVRLPIKNLAQCKTVCKKWHRFISSPSFAFRHFQIIQSCRRKSPLFYVLCSLVTKALLAPVSFSATGELIRYPRINLPYIQPWIGRIWVDGMVNYKVFSAGYGIYCFFETLTKQILLWNPTTKEHRVLPPSSYVTSSSEDDDFLFGEMGYKDGNFSYKVGRVTSKLTPDSVYTRDTGGHVSVTLELYSSETDCWKVIPDFASGQYFKCSDSVLRFANLNGRAHWVFQSATEEEDTYITTFDYETELFGRIKPPPQIGGCGYNKLRCLVTTFHDKFLCLGLFQEIHGEGSSYLDIWVMLRYEDEDSWTKKLTVGPIPDDFEVIEISSKLNGVFLWNSQPSRTELLFWNFKSPKIEGYYSMGEMRPGFWLSPELQVVEQVESLVSILK